MTMLAPSPPSLDVTAAWCSGVAAGDARAQELAATESWEPGYAANFAKWSRIALGYRALLQHAGLPVPSISDAYQATHGWCIFGSDDLSMVLRFIREAAAAALAKPLGDVQSWSLYQQVSSLQSAVAAIDGAGADAEALELFEREYRTAYPGKRKGTKHWKEKWVGAAAKAREIAVVERRERCAEQAARLRRDVLAHETRWTSLAKEAEKLHRLALEAGRLCGDLDLAQRAAERADAILASITEERQRVAAALKPAPTDTGAGK